APGETVNFAPSLTSGGPASILLTNGSLVVSKSLTVDGPGDDLLTINAQLNSRVFDITNATGDVTLNGLTLTNGKTTASGSAGSGGPNRSFAGGLLAPHEGTLHVIVHTSATA